MKYKLTYSMLDVMMSSPDRPRKTEMRIQDILHGRAKEKDVRLTT